MSLVEALPIRARNAAATRATILEAARRRFAAEGFDDVGMRDVARDAGVDAALVSRYFGSKDELFIAALDACGDCPMVDRERSTFGETLAHELLFGEEGGQDHTWLLIMLRSVGSLRAGALVRTFVTERFSGPLADWIGGPDAAMRCALVSSLMLGVSVNRELGGCMDLDAAGKAALHRRLAATLQSMIDG